MVEHNRNLKDDYKVDSGIIGEGSFASVKKGRSKATGEKVAIKIIQKGTMNEEDKLALQTEIDILKQVDHPNIVKMIDVYEDQDNYFLVMELMTGGELFDVLLEKEQFSEKEARDVITPIIDAIQYCHSLGIVHRDIKPENLLFSTKDSESSIIKVSDFGLARFVDDEALATTTCGTPGYVAPEILSQKPYGQECDYWSIGVVLFILLSGMPPFYDEDNFVLFEKIKKGEFDFSAPSWQSISESPKDIIRKLLVVDPKERMQPEDLLKHPWIKGEITTVDIGVLGKMREWNSKRKLAQ